MALKNAIKIDAFAPQSGARVTSPAGCQQRQPAPRGTSNSQSGKSNVIPLPLTADAAVRVWRPLAAELGEKVAAANGRPDLKDDLISIGEEALWRAWQSYDPQRAKWPTYAENRVWWAMKHWIEKELHTRRKHPVIEIELDEEVEGKVPGAEDLMIMQLEGEEIQRAVQCLTERQQKILELVYTRGLSVTGVAKGMGLGRTTVSNELNSALRQIRKTLKF